MTRLIIPAAQGRATPTRRRAAQPGGGAQGNPLPPTPQPPCNVSSQNYRRAASESEKAASYTYDNLHRLTGFNLDSGSSTQSYEYDRNGNITQITADGAAIHHSYSRSTTPNRLDAIFGASPYTQFAYNANGWTTSVGAVPVTYATVGSPPVMHSR